MSFRDNLYKYVSEIATIPTVYVGLAPQDAALPHIVMSRVNHTPDYTFAGESGMTNDLWQFDIWAATALSAESTYALLRTNLSAKTGSIGIAGSLSVILDSYIQSVVDQVSTRDDGSEDLYYRAILTVSITYRS